MDHLQGEMAEHRPVIVNVLNFILHLFGSLDISRILDVRNNLLGGEFLLSMIMFLHSFQLCIRSATSCPKIISSFFIVKDVCRVDDSVILVMVVGRCHVACLDLFVLLCE